MRTKIFFNRLHHNVFRFIKSSRYINVTDIVGKSSVIFLFIITTVAKKKPGVAVVQESFI